MGAFSYIMVLWGVGGGGGGICGGGGGVALGGVV